MHGIKVLMAKNYIDNLSEESSKGMQEKAEQGIYPSFAPLGYRNILGQMGKKIIEPDPDSASVVTRLFEQYSTGNYSVKELARFARNEGLVFRKSRKPVPQATIHKILRNRIYTGDFDWKRKTFQGIHTPLVSQELWGKVQAVLDQRFAKRHRKQKHDFAFSGLITCGHCGCSFVGEVKKEKYVYYHCTGYKGKCGEPYTREEVLEEKFTELLKNLEMDEEVLAWVSEALLLSHQDEKKHHDEAIQRLHSEYNRLQGRVDSMYVDKLDGVVDADFFQRKSAEWRSEQDRILRSIEEHQSANQNYLTEGVQLLELVGRAHNLFQKQEPREKRRLLNFVLSNCVWKDGDMAVEYRQPFDIISGTATKVRNEESIRGVSEPNIDNWLPGG